MSARHSGPRVVRWQPDTGDGVEALAGELFAQLPPAPRLSDDARDRHLARLAAATRRPNLGSQTRVRLALGVGLALFGSVALAASRTDLPAAIMRWIRNEPPPAAPLRAISGPSTAEPEPQEVEIAVEPGSLVVRPGTLEVPAESWATLTPQGPGAFDTGRAPDAQGPGQSPPTPERPGPREQPQAVESPKPRLVKEPSGAPGVAGALHDLPIAEGAGQHEAQTEQLPEIGFSSDSGASPGALPEAPLPLPAAPPSDAAKAVPGKPASPTFVIPCSGPLARTGGVPGLGEPVDPWDEDLPFPPTSDECRTEISRLTEALAEPATDGEAESDLISRAVCHAILGDAGSCQADLSLYLSRFPNGRFVTRARVMLHY